MFKRVAALYDIHGNLPALEAVLRDVLVEDVDLVVVGGDVLPGPIVGETIDRLLSLDIPTRFIQGNGDREVLAKKARLETRALPEAIGEMIRWVAEHLRPEDERLLASWPATLGVPVLGIGDVLFVHATPENDTDIFTQLTAEARLRPLFDPLEVPLVVCGHTHMQFDRTVGAVRVVNAGSVGMPFDEPGAYWLLLGPDVELRHTRYDLQAAAERVRATNYPQAEEFASRNILQPPSKADTLKAFAAYELK